MQKLAKLVLLVVVGAALCGCEGSEEYHSRKCVQWGAQYQSPDYVRCMATMAKNEELDAEASAAIAVAASTAASSGGRR